MKFALICVLLVSLFYFAQPDESADASAEADFYAKYYQEYYNSIAAKEDADRDSGYHEPSAAYAEPSYAAASYDAEPFDLSSMLGPDPGVTIGLISGALTLLALIGVFVNANNINSLSNDQDSICTSVSTLGGTTFATVAAAPTQAQFNALTAALNTVANPSC
jgi:hypothetical protein